MQKSDFDKLLERYVTNETSQDETAKINAWLDVAKAQKFNEAEFTEKDQEDLFKKITGNLGLDEFKEQIPKKKVSRGTITGIAASILLLISVSTFLLLKNSTSEVEKIILNDGTIVWLKGGGSRINYFEKKNDPIRYAELTGEGLFEVSKNANRPFIISCGDVKIQVLGTSFNVKFVNDSLYLDVLTGVVKVTSGNDSTGIKVNANESVIYSQDREIVEESLSRTEIKEITERTEYNMQFDKVKVSEILSRMAKKFDVEIKGNESFVDCSVNGDFTDHSLDSSLKMLSEIIDMQYVISGRIITVSGKGCN